MPQPPAGGSRPAPVGPDAPRLLALAAYRFPHGDAMSNRLLHLVRSAIPPGGSVIVVNDWPADGTRPPTQLALPAEVQVLTLAAARMGKLARWWHRQWRPLRVLAALRRAGIDRRELSGVCLPLGLWNLTTWAVLRLAVRRPVTVDIVERHDPQQFARGRLTPYFIRHRWAMFLALRLADRIIAISSALHHDFAYRRPTLLVPPQVDRAAYEPPAPPSLDDGVRLLYAGTASAKDLLAVVVEGIRRLPEAQRRRVRLTIAGMTRDQAVSSSDLDGSSLDGMDNQVTFLGRVPREQVLAELRSAHFSILVRPDVGYSRAGFPSKVPESLAAGCPVLLNHTSDLAHYVTDGREGLVLARPTSEDVRTVLLRALAMDDEGWRRMSHCARERADDFDYRTWTPVVSAFVIGAGSGAAHGSGTESAASAVNSSAVSRRSGG